MNSPLFGTITQEERTSATVAGFMYLFLGALAAFAEFYVRSGILVHANAAQTAHNILTSERLFRIGLAIDLVGGACNAILAVAFYAMLKRVSSSLALLAAFWRLGEAVILGHMSLNGMTVLSILSHPALSQAFSPGQLQALASLYLNTQGDEFSIGLVYYFVGVNVVLLSAPEVPVRPKILGLVGSGLLVRGAHKHARDHRGPRRRRYRSSVLCPGRHFRNRRRILAADRWDTYPSSCFSYLGASVRVQLPDRQVTPMSSFRYQSTKRAA